MPAARLLLLPLALILLAALTSGCGDSDNSASSGSNVTPSPATPFTLGALVIRGQQVPLPEGVLVQNQSQQCASEQAATTDACANDNKLISYHMSYILLDPKVPRALARRIDPQDDSVLRPILDLIAGRSPSPTAAS